MAFQMFLSARPERGATTVAARRRLGFDVSIRTPRAGRDLYYANVPRLVEDVSIRTPRAGRDADTHHALHVAGVSIRTPRAGRDMNFAKHLEAQAKFLSARPERGATHKAPAVSSGGHSFYPHAPSGARLFTTC